MCVYNKRIYFPFFICCRPVHRKNVSYSLPLLFASLNHRPPSVHVDVIAVVSLLHSKFEYCRVALLLNVLFFSNAMDMYLKRAFDAVGAAVEYDIIFMFISWALFLLSFTLSLFPSIRIRAACSG